MKILITGAGGQLGRSLVRAMATKHEVIALTHAELDVTQEMGLRTQIGVLRPDVIIHTAALTDTNLCEREPGLARRTNATGAENVGIASVEAGARFVHISTNEVFDGQAGRPYVEDDPTNPLNEYGRSKRDSEIWAETVSMDLLIVRTSWLYGAGYVNFNEKVLTAAKEGRKLSFVTDEIATPTSTDDLAAGIGALLERDAPAGVYHLSNEGEASRYEWAMEILRLAGMGDREVAAVTMAELRANGYAGPVKPPYSVLANTRAAALGVTLRPWREALAAYFAARVDT